MGGLILAFLVCTLVGIIFGFIGGVVYQDHQLAKLIDEEQKTLEKSINEIVSNQ